MPISGHVEWISVAIKGSGREGFLGWGENDWGKGEEIRKKWQSGGKKWTYSVHYWLSWFFLLTPYRLFCLCIYFLVWPSWLWPCCFIFFSHYHWVVLFLRFQSPDGTFLTVKTKTGLPTPLKQLAQLHNVNNCHRDTSLSWQHAVT